MSNVLARIHRVEKSKLPDNVESLKIDEKNIKFFQVALFSEDSKCNFYYDSDGKWWLHFFIGYDYEVVYCVNFVEIALANHEQGSNKHSYCKEILENNRLDRGLRGRELARLAFLCIQEPSEKDEAAEYASLLIRGTKSIKGKDYHQESYHHTHIDGRGLAFITKNSIQYAYFQRHTLLLALAHAYIDVTEHFTNKLSNTTQYANNDNAEELTTLYAQMAKFNAHFFFHNPVQHQNTGLVSAWNKIDSALGVSKMNDELLKQISTIHYILDLQNNKRQQRAEEKRQKTEDKRNSLIAIFGLIISIIGLIELFK